MNPVVISGAVLAVGAASLAVGFAGRQWLERKRRPGGLSAADAAYFRGKDHRRLAGSVVLGLVAAGMAAGLMVDPRRGVEAARFWVASWSIVLSLLLLLLALAFWDGLALHAYARRHRRALQRERELLLEDLARIVHEAPPAVEGNGTGVSS